MTYSTGLASGSGRCPEVPPEPCPELRRRDDEGLVEGLLFAVSLDYGQGGLRSPNNYTHFSTMRAFGQESSCQETLFVVYLMPGRNDNVRQIILTNSQRGSESWNGNN